MPALPSKYKESSDTAHVIGNNKDSINAGLILKIDTAIKDSTVYTTDSISVPQILKTDDSVKMFSDTSGLKQTVIKKTIIIKPSDAVKLNKTETTSSQSKLLIRDSGDNFLTLLSKEYPKYSSTTVFKTSPNKLVASEKTESIRPLKRNEISNDWYLGIIVFIVLLFLWIKIFYNKYFSVLFNSLLNYQVSLKLLREKSVLTKRVSFALNLIYIIVLAIFIFNLVEFYQIRLFNLSKIETLLLLINLIVILSVVRILLLNVTGLLFNSMGIFNEYIHNNYVINKNLGLFLFPLIIIQVYMSEKLTVIFIITGIILIILSHIIRLYRGFQIIIKKDIFLFYLILYLCTLEILPLLLGYKFFLSLI